MKKIFPFIVVLLGACHAKDPATLTFVNKSQTEIDSIVLNHPEKIRIENLGVGQQQKVHINDALKGDYREGIFSYTIYSKGKKRSGLWGVHDFGSLARNSETFYIFDHGTSMSEKPLEKPKTLTVFFYNASQETIDSFVNVDNSIKGIREFTPRSFEIVVDFEKAEKMKVFSVIMNGKKRTSGIEHDFDNWNENQTFFQYETDSLKAGPGRNREPQEFIFELFVKLDISSDSVKVESPAAVKSYYSSQPKYLKVIFDFKKLKQNPVFKVYVLEKVYVVDLSSHDFSNYYYNQVIYYLEDKGIRSLMN